MVQINPDNEALVKFMDLDGDPNEGHEDELPQAPVAATPTGKPVEGDLEPEVMVDMTGGEEPKDPEEAPPTEEPTPVEEPPTEPEPEQLGQAEEPPPESKKLTPWERANQAKREAAEARRLQQEAEARAQASEALVKQQQQRLDQIEAYLQGQAQAAQRQQQPTPEPKPLEVPAYEENPLGNLATRQTMTEKIIQDFNARQQQLEAATVRQQFEGRITVEEAAYAQHKPDYYKARDYLIESAWKEGRAAGMTDAQIGQTIDAYRVQFARTAWTNGKSIAEIVEQVAQSRGYRPTVDEPEPEPAKQNGQQAREKVQVAAQRQVQANASLATTARTVGRPQALPTRQQVIDADEAQMDEWDRTLGQGWMGKVMEQGAR